MAPKGCLPSVVQNCHGHLEAASDLAQHILNRHLAAVECQLHCVRAADAQFGLRLAWNDATKLLLNDKRSDLSVRGRSSHSRSIGELKQPTHRYCTGITRRSMRRPMQKSMQCCMSQRKSIHRHKLQDRRQRPCAVATPQRPRTLSGPPSGLGVLANTVKTSAMPPLEIHILLPLMTKCLPSSVGVALVLMPAASLPALGSVSTNAAV